MGFGEESDVSEWNKEHGDFCAMCAEASTCPRAHTVKVCEFRRKYVLVGEEKELS